MSFPRAIAELGRCHAVFIFETPGEMAVVGKADQDPNLFYLKETLRIGEHFADLFQPQII